jgi:hypothetical protein
MLAMRNNHTDLVDSVWCLVFSVSSIGGWLWFCWYLSFQG